VGRQVLGKYTVVSKARVRVFRVHYPVQKLLKGSFGVLSTCGAAAGGPGRVDVKFQDTLHCRGQGEAPPACCTSSSLISQQRGGVSVPAKHCQRALRLRASWHAPSSRHPKQRGTHGDWARRQTRCSPCSVGN